ncbi:MAG: Xaa-Pro peptidase family protein [Fimbriimonadales bacterium]|nr:Xaa-Pro peptidase family protein [Fimbriimonadales bacterium]
MRHRQEALRRAVAASGLDALALFPGPLEQWVFGASDWRTAADLREDAPLRLASAEGIVPFPGSGQTLPLRKLGLAGFPSRTWLANLRRALPEAEWVDADGLLDAARSVKEPEEIERLRRAAELTDRCMEAVARNLRPGATMRDVELEIEFQGRRLGASAVSFPPACGFVHPSLGASDQIANAPADWPLQSGTVVFFDVGFVVDGYCSDWGRSVHLGAPPAATRKAYAALCEAMEETVAGIAPGQTRANDVYPALEAALDARGFGDDLRRRLGEARIVGHSIGVEVHERPWLGPSDGRRLEPGMVLAIEPKLWRPGEYYLRLEEMVLVTSRGAEFLTGFPRGLFEL